MPVTSVSFFLGSGQPAFTTATSVGAPEYIDPLEGTTEFAGVRQTFWQTATAYTAATLNTVATYLGVACYLTEEGGFSDVGGGIMQFSREYRRIPSTQTNYIGTLAYPFPGREVTSTTVSSVTISNYDPYNGVLARYYTPTAHGYSNGDMVFVNLVQSTGSARKQDFYYSKNVIVTGVVATMFLAPQIAPSAFFVSGTASKITGNYPCPPRTRQSDSYVVNEYFLPGVSTDVTSVSDILPHAQFQVVQFGTTSITQSDTYTCTSATSPTAQEYSNLVASGSYLIAESVVERYAGNIYVRRTTYVRAL